MVDTVILHVGPHKTGTTALQRALAENAAVLARHGVLYPATGRLDDSHAMLAEAVRREDATLLAALAAEASGWRAVLISSENLSALKPEALVALRQVFPGAEFRISYTLRRLATLWPSHWGELIKHGQCLTFAGYLDRVATRDDRPYHAPILPQRQLDRLASAFGETALHIGVYEARLEGGCDIGPAFIDDLLGLGHLAPQFSTRRVNRTPSDLITAVVYLMNQHVDGKLDYPSKQRLRLALLSVCRAVPPPVWLAPVDEALQRAGRLVLTEDHPMVQKEQAALVTRYGQALQDPVESYLAPAATSVPQLETLRLDGETQSLLTNQFDTLLGEQPT